MDATTTRRDLDRARHTRPASPGHLWKWVVAYTGVRIARHAVCRGHCAPFDAFAEQWFDPPPFGLVWANRGGGKSFDAAILTHLFSRWNRGYGTRILGGSKAQSLQIYQGLDEAIRDGRGPLGSDGGELARLLRSEATYRNGSNVSILAASPTSVRGPHVPCLRLDEVDEIDPDIRESAIGMAMEDVRRGYRTQVAMTSTWHRLDGPMAGLVERGLAGQLKMWNYCAFDVLERCPVERSGPALEHCPGCPIRPWCHADIDEHGGVPRAKRSDGHYTIDSLIQKVGIVSRRTFEADYLCLGPRADGLIFPEFDEARNVGTEAEYDPSLPVILAIDCGTSTHTAAVWMQARELAGDRFKVTIFADYHIEGLVSEDNARAIVDVGLRRCNGRLDRVRVDPASNQRTGVGPVVYATYQSVFGRSLAHWPTHRVADGLDLIDTLVRAADGTVGLIVHPRCEHMIRSFKTYKRARRGTEWLAQPADPQHPAEDLMDALRGGLIDRFPRGLAHREPNFRRVPASRVLF